MTTPPTPRGSGARHGRVLTDQWGVPAPDRDVELAVARQIDRAAPAESRVIMLRRLGAACGLLAFAIGVVSMLRIVFATQAPSTLMMPLPSSLAAILMGIVGLLVSYGRSGWQRVICEMILVFSGLFATAYLVLWLSGHLELIVRGEASPSMLTAIGWMLVAAGTLLDLHGLHRPGQLLLFAASSMVLLVLIGHFYGATLVLALPHSPPIPVLSAITLGLVAISSMTAEAGRGYVGLITGETLGGDVARRLFPMVLTIPPTVGWLLMQAYNRGVITANTTMTWVVVISIAVTACVSWWLAARLHGVDSRRKTVEVELSEVRRLLVERDMLAESLSEANRDLESFAAIAAHDLRSPLVTIRGYAELLSSDAGSSPRALPWINKILRATDRGGALVNDLLAYSTASRSERETSIVDLTALGREVQLLAGRPDAVTIKPMPLVHGEMALLRQMLLNLVQNSLKYMPEGRQPLVVVDTMPGSAQSTVLRVSDNGAGIPEGDRERLMQMFERGSSTVSGSGIGLAICSRVAERHGGRLWIGDSELGGAVVNVELPLVPLRRVGG